jgi:hypothetical protein
LAGFKTIEPDKAGAEEKKEARTKIINGQKGDQAGDIVIDKLIHLFSKLLHSEKHV